ncbi:MAG: CD1247 N-terminal domain-containing protein [Syntrophomonadaceae bacterium]
MREISEKISYLQGLCEGMNIGENTSQGKIILGILAVLDDLATETRELRGSLRDFHDYLQTIDDDLFELQESLIDEEDEDDDDYIELTCSKCGEELYFDAEVLDDEDKIEIICPSCNEVVFIHDGAFDFEPTPIDEEGEQREASRLHS